MWVNAMYWAGASWMERYLNGVGIKRNPVAYELGMSGECLCGAFASRGELAIVRRVDPEIAERIERLQRETMAAGVHCKWEERPPKERDAQTGDLFNPLCVNCLKSPLRDAA